MPETKVGDRVRVTFEGKVAYRTNEYLELWTGKMNRAFTFGSLPDGFEVEVLEPAVGVFKPGDIVEDKATGLRFQLLPGSKYMSQAQLRVYSHIPGYFTSEHFTKVAHINELLKS